MYETSDKECLLAQVIHKYISRAVTSVINKIGVTNIIGKFF